MRSTYLIAFLVGCAALVMSTACQSARSSPAVNRRDPQAVLSAYFAAWTRNDTTAQASFMTPSSARLAHEPVDSVNVLSVNLLDEKTSRLWSSGSPETMRVYLVTFDYKPTGRGFSMGRGRYTWTYTLTWDATRDSWLIASYGAG
jgi:hypothetical protein